MGCIHVYMWRCVVYYVGCVNAWRCVMYSVGCVHV